MIAAVTTRLPRLSIHDPGLVSLRSALRAALVMPAVFALANVVIGDPQLATFAAFGSFAMLVLVELGGPLHSRAVAYAALAAVGALDVVVGTACSQNAWLAAVAMAAVGFAILLSGAISGYFAAAGTSALLTFILAVTIPAPFSAVGARLEGWALAAGAGICAQLLLWPTRRQASLRDDAARVCVALAELADAALAREREATATLTAAAGEAMGALRSRFLAAPRRPTGPTAREAALSSLVDELDWLLATLAPPVESPALSVCETENAAAVAAVVATLRAAAATLRGGDAEPDLAQLDETRRAVVQALAQRIPQLPAVPDDEALAAALEPAFRIRVLSYGARTVARQALAASGRTAAGEPGDEPAHLRSALQTTERIAAEQASARSVWFRNSIRGAVGLAVAVYIAQRSGLQHGFWVVLGMLSVLRSNALGTGWSVVSAIAGTSAGIVVGAGLVLAIGTHHAVLWIVLPLAVLLGAYAPRAISFAAGQAAFTVVLFVLYNLIQPSGWRVGLVRIEDVAIGFAISLGVGLLFWPRGAAKLLRENLAFAYARSADYVVAAESELIAGVGDTAAAAQAADLADHRLDDAFRQYLTERSPEIAGRETVATLVAGAGRVRRAAQSLSALARAGEGDSLARCGANLDAEVHALRSWYVTLGDSLVHSTAVPPPHVRDTDGRRRLLECVREALTAGDATRRRAALSLLWASQHLDTLWQLEQHLGRAGRAYGPRAGD
jgi:uncharacterized membrane protein YccC